MFHKLTLQIDSLSSSICESDAERSKVIDVHCHGHHIVLLKYNRARNQGGDPQRSLSNQDQCQNSPPEAGM